MIERKLSVLSDLDEVPVGITHVAAPFPAVGIRQRLRKKGRAFLSPLFVADPDVGDPQIEEAIQSVEIRWCFKKDLWLIGNWAPSTIKNDPGVSQLDIAGIFRLDYFPAKNAGVEVLGFFLVPHGEEVRGEKAFACNRRIGQTHAVHPVSIKQ